MSDIAALVSDHLDIWTAASERNSRVGRGANRRLSLYGIERLRTLILDLALRGKLVSQVASDEPAPELMKRVERLKAAVEGKAAKAEAAIPPSDVPAGWVLVRLADLANPQAGFAFKSVGFNELGVGLPLIRIRDVGQPFTGTFYSGNYRSEFEVQKGDYLISMDGEFRVATWDGPKALLNQRVSRLQFYGDEVVRPFVGMALQAELMQLQGVKAYTTVDHLSGKQIAGSVIRLPPHAEQRRIVAKVGELMALCDALEGESSAALTAHQTLVEALLATIVGSSDAADLAANWTRLETHFDILFTTEDSVDALKRTILDLAVRGRLVAQDKKDGPATQLAQQLRKAVPKAKLHPPVSQEEIPFELPDGWAWERFDHIIRAEKPIAYGVLVPGNDEPNGVPFVRIADLSITASSYLPEKAISSVVDAKFPRTRLEGGEILMGVVGSIGKLGVAPASWAGANIARAICRIVPVEQVNRDYILWLLQSRYMQERFKGDTRTLAQPTLNIKLIRMAPTPIPPVDEQRRIVAKVGALMTLCDNLKASIADSGKIQMRFADAIVERVAA